MPELKKKLIIPALVLSLLPLTGIAQSTPDKLIIDQVKFSDLRGWDKEMSYDESGQTGIDNQLGTLSSFVHSCKQFLKLPVDTNLGWPARMVGDWHSICKKAIDLQTDIRKTKHYGNRVKKFFEQNFTPFKASNNKDSVGLFTGYYETELNGSREKTDKYKFPLYKKPKKLRGCLTRAQIDKGVLDGEKLELLYVEDKVELFFLHIQGSGRIRLEDGSFVRVGYAGKNGCDYTSIGGHLADIGAISHKNMSAQAIKKWLRANPDKAQSVLNKNESFVFFREVKANAITGAQGVPLTPKHSVAIDRRYIPFAMPLWIETQLPNGNELNTLAIAQDTGSAIKGPVRADIFFGHGDEAANLAGKMKQKGEYYLLIPNDVSVF